MSDQRRKNQYSIKTDFSLLAILLIPIAVAINFAGGQLASLLKLPLYLDTIGTIFTALLAGPWIGALAGALTNIVTGIANPVNFAFIPVNVAVGLATGFLARGHFFNVWWKWGISVILISLVSIIVAAPIVVILFGGITGGGSSLVTATLLAAGSNVWVAVIGTDGLFNLIDRIVSAVISLLVIRIIPDRTLIKFGVGKNYLGKKGDSGEKS
ncbi:MAG: ECF transporter S component [Treponema sp.]|jgi:energy-coupling factor transport system substrate-specific component|nr:ECF transporter S component [Treponema sp.]